MRNTKKKWLIFAMLLTFFPFDFVEATVINQVGTTGTIGFEGIYIPIGTPEPAPPDSSIIEPITEVAKPGGTLPQTNGVSRLMLFWLGVLLINFFFFLWKRQSNQNKN